MHILFLTHYFPPEVNAPASRTYENSRRWVGDDCRVTIITCAPNHPNGIIYPGYKNRLWQWEQIDGIDVLRVKTYLSANKGFFKRTLNYISFMLSAVFFCRLVGSVDVVVSTSPQFFCGMAGYFIARIKRRPWILEIRDLWPESIIAVGALKNRFIIRWLEKIETFLYAQANHIVALTHAFKRHICSRGVAANKISVITNGADLDRFQPLPKESAIRKQYGLNGKFVAAFIGTHGMAHGLETLFKAAQLLKDQPGIVWLLVGDGAERENLLLQKEKLGLNNILMLSQQPKNKIPEFIAASDVCIALLKKRKVFKKVIPSKIFEAMAMERPIILGLEGECKEIIQRGKCGICIEPENETQLSEAVMKLYNENKLLDLLGKNGSRFVVKEFGRGELAEQYLKVCKRIINDNRGPI
jgi:glycosyltransferase involved in cell wall biosynthesis